MFLLCFRVAISFRFRFSFHITCISVSVFVMSTFTEIKRLILER